MTSRLFQSLAAVLVVAGFLISSVAGAGAADNRDAQLQPGAADSQLAKVVEVIARDVDSLWRETLTAGGVDYTSPGVVLFDGPVTSACGDAEPATVGPFYCPLDQTVYLDAPVLLWINEQFGISAVAFVIAHEWAHHVQQQLGITKTRVSANLTGVSSLQLELMADCLGGAWFMVTETEGRLDASSIDQVVVFLAALAGDSADTPHDHQHGTGALRAWWFLQGYYNGASACVASPS